MTEDHRKILKSLIGKKKIYQKKEIEVLDFKQVNGIIVVKTNIRTYTFYPSEIDDFFNNLSDGKKTLYKPKRQNTTQKKVKSKTPTQNIDINKDRLSRDGKHLIPSDNDVFNLLNSSENALIPTEITAKLSEIKGKNIKVHSINNALERMLKNSLVFKHKINDVTLYSTKEQHTPLYHANDHLENIANDLLEINKIKLKIDKGLEEIGEKHDVSNFPEVDQNFAMILSKEKENMLCMASHYLLRVEQIDELLALYLGDF